LKSIESGKSAVNFEEEINSEKAITEFIFLGLSKGIDVNEFNKQFNQTLKIIFTFNKLFSL
jgi:coproporphyrinogen III oxidase-like Fe-S oxidoreductase